MSLHQSENTGKDKKEVRKEKEWKRKKEKRTRKRRGFAPGST